MEYTANSIIFDKDSEAKQNGIIKLKPKKMPQLQRSEIELSNGNKICIIHNLPDHGLNIQDALINWTERAKDYNAESFCKYIMSKDTNLLALTEEKFNKIKNRN